MTGLGLTQKGKHMAEQNRLAIGNGLTATAVTSWATTIDDCRVVLRGLDSESRPIELDLDAPTVSALYALMVRAFEAKAAAAQARLDDDVPF